MKFIMSGQFKFWDKDGCWLWYSHGDAPTDRPVVTGYQDPNRPGLRMAQHYFLNDRAHQAIGFADYTLTPIDYAQWEIEFTQTKQAVIFKLMYL